MSSVIRNAAFAVGPPVTSDTAESARAPEYFNHPTLPSWKSKLPSSDCVSSSAVAARPADVDADDALPDAFEALVAA